VKKKQKKIQGARRGKKKKTWGQSPARGKARETRKIPHKRHAQNKIVGGGNDGTMEKGEGSRVLLWKMETLEHKGEKKESPLRMKA